MEMAYSVAKLSYAARRQVGCVIIKDNQIISFGYNGTPHGFDNECENIEVLDNVNTADAHQLLYMGFEMVDDHSCIKKTTKKEVLHAESNALTKIAKSTLSSEGSILYTTTAPCFECSKLIIQSGIKEVYFNETYRDMSGVELLNKANIKVNKTNVIC